jgi:hypothetical protein
MGRPASRASLLLSLVLLALSACSQVENANDQHLETAAEAQPPAGVPANAKLIGGDALKKLLLGHALRPIRQPANPSIGTERFQKSGQWERFSLPLDVSGLPMLSRSVGWNVDGYCVRPNDAGPVCSQIWRNSSQLFVV